MRSRAIQPRSLFRITAGANTAACSSSTTQHPLPPRRASSTSAAAPSTATRPRHRSRSASLRRSSISNSSPSSSPSSSASPKSARQALKLSGLSLHDAVVPVRPPPHSDVSVGLQAFFSQGRPLLEHNNLFDKSHAFGGSKHASSYDAPSISGNANAMVVVLPGELGKEDSSLDAEIKRKAGALMERMMEMRDQLEEASPEERASMFKEMTGRGSKKAIEARDVSKEELISNLLEGTTMADGSDSRVKLLSFSLHLPPLRSVSPTSFNKILSPSKSAAAKTPLSLHISIAQDQAWQAERDRAVSSALERGEDTTVAQSLGPEADLIVVGEPEGPHAEWGKGVASYLARFGNAYQAPPAPQAGEAAAHVKGLDDVASYQVHRDESSIIEDGEILDAQADAYEAATENAAWPLSSGSLEDVNLWLGHALVQDKMRAGLDWQRVVAQMDASVDGASRTARLPSMREGLMNMRSLRAFPRGASGGLETIAVRPTADMTIGDASQRGEVGEQKQQEVEEGTVVQMDSTRRKRLKKMNKMKYKKLRKKQRAERQRLKK